MWIAARVVEKGLSEIVFAFGRPVVPAKLGLGMATTNGVPMVLKSSEAPVAFKSGEAERSLTARVISR